MTEIEKTELTKQLVLVLQELYCVQIFDRGVVATRIRAAIDETIPDTGEEE
jgi:hypothetical protein